MTRQGQTTAESSSSPASLHFASACSFPPGCATLKMCSAAMLVKTRWPKRPRPVMSGLRKHGSGRWRATSGTCLMHRGGMHCHLPCFSSSGPEEHPTVNQEMESDARQSPKEKEPKRNAPKPRAGSDEYGDPFSPSPGFGSRHNLQAFRKALFLKRVGYCLIEDIERFDTSSQIILCLIRSFNCLFLSVHLFFSS